MDGYRHQTPVTIRYGDLDTLGHVNNARFLTYLEQARVHYYIDLGLWDGQRSTKGVIVARISIDYKLPLLMEDREAIVWSRCSRLGNKSMDIESVVQRKRDGAAAALGVVVLVAFDYETDQTIVIPDEWRRRIQDYETEINFG